MLDDSKGISAFMNSNSVETAPVLPSMIEDGNKELLSSKIIPKSTKKY